MASTNETETFQHYQVLRRADGTLHELGRGAMGVTYKAFDTNLRSYVALKVINALHLDSETARARFLREARAAAALRHRNIASVYHLGNDDQSFFYAMEFVDGQTLESLVKENNASLPATDALQITLQASRALGAAGKQGLVHRDIKPANIMVQREDDEDDGFVVKVIDFGLARSAAGGEGSAHITMGGFVGTPQYASPEQLEEKDLDIRSDIYSLGVTLWYMLVGRPPFVGPLGSVFIQQMTKEPPWEQVAAQPDPVKALLARLLQKDPDKRPQSPAELRREIEVCLRKLPPSATRGAILPPSPVPDTVGGDTAGGSRTSLNKTRAATGTVSGTASTPEPVAPVPAPADFSARPAVIATGTLLMGRYDLGDFIGQGNNGRVFRARDLAREQRTVAVKVLHADVLGSDGERTRLEETLAKLRRAPYPHLIEVEGLEQTPGCRFLVQEWVSGFTLVDLLRSRGQLPVRETLQLLAQTAAAADHAYGNGLDRLELGLHQILVHFPSVAAGSQAGRALLGTSLDKWPVDFSLKLDALGITREAGDSVTWGGDMTMMPSAPMLGRDTQTSIRGLVEGSQFFALGMLTYELLNGAPPVQGRGEDGRGIKYAVLPSLNEDANDVLRRMLTPNPGFASGQEFFLALCKASGIAAPHAASTTITPPTARIAPVETSSPGETMAFESSAEIHGETMVFDEGRDSGLDAVLTARAPGVLPPQEESEADQIAEAERIAEAEQAAEAERLAEAERIAEARRLEEVDRAAEAERIAEVERIAEAERLAEQQRLAEAERIAEARRAEAERVAEVERIAEAERLAETRRLAEEKRLAEAARAAEAKRLAEEQRLREAEERAEAKRIAEAERAAEAARVADAKRLAKAEKLAEAERAAETKRVEKAERLAAAKRASEAAARATAPAVAESISVGRDVPLTDHPEPVAPRGRKPLVIGSLVAIVAVGGLVAFFLSHGSHNAAPATQTASIPGTPPAAKASPPVVAETRPAQGSPPAATPSVINPVADVATPEPMAATTPPAATPEPMPATRVVEASTPPPPVQSNVSTPPPETRPHVRETAPRDRDAEKQESERREVAKHEAERRESEQRAETERRDSERRDNREAAREDAKPKSTPKPKQVIAKATPPPKKESSKPAATPDPNANRGGPGIGFMR